MKKCLIIGAYGCGNRGDDAILQSISRQLSHFQITATNGTYEDMAEYLSIKTIPCRMNEGISLPVVFSMIKDSFSILFHVVKADAIIYGGGSLIHDLTRYNLPFLYFWHMVAKILRKKVYYANMGGGPLRTKTGKQLSRYFLKKADGVFVRDERGLKICKDLGICNAVLVCDAAFAVTDISPNKNDLLAHLGLEERNYACVTVSGWFESSNFWDRKHIDFKMQTEKLAQEIKEFYKIINKKLVFVPTVTYDIKLLETLKDLLEDCDCIIIPPNYGCVEMAEIIANSYLLFGIRMHSIIFAARRATPFISLIYDEKVQQVLHFLDMEAYACTIGQASPEKVANITQNVIDHYTEIQNKLKTKADAARIKALECLNKIRSDLEAI